MESAHLRQIEELAASLRTRLIERRRAVAAAGEGAVEFGEEVEMLVAERACLLGDERLDLLVKTGGSLARRRNRAAPLDQSGAERGGELLDLPEMGGLHR